MAQLITVPTFTFNQGSLFDSEANAERPIHVDYYNGTIVLRQDGEFANQERINISPEFLDALFKEIKKHMPHAVVMLGRTK